jgi:hypothetical protein
MKHAVRISLIILLGTAAFLASGCSEPDTTLPYSIEIEEEKAGRITSETPFDASHIASLMPGFDVKPYTAFSAGMPHTVLRVSRHERPIMSIMPTPDGKRVHSVTVHDPEVTAQRRVHVGAPFAKIFHCAEPCSRADEYGKDKALCKAPGSLHIFYLFTLDGSQTDDLQTLETLGTTPVEAIIWKSDA